MTADVRVPNLDARDNTAPVPTCTLSLYPASEASDDLSQTT